MDEPVALSMVSDDDDMAKAFQFQPTTPPTEEARSGTTMPQSKATNSPEPKGKALNFTLDENNQENNLSGNLSTFDKFGDLSDVDMDNDEGDVTPMAKILSPKVTESNNKTSGRF